MTGMDPVTKLVSLADSAETRDLGALTLGENAVMLDEAVVTAVRAAVVAKEDTLEFNAGSFHTNPNASVEDLLKKLPGVEDATVSFMMQKLTVTADEGRFEEIMDQIERACKKVEPDCRIVR